MNRAEVQGKERSKQKGAKLSGARHSNSQAGISRTIKAHKRAEAEARNAKTPRVRTRRWRMGN